MDTRSTVTELYKAYRTGDAEKVASLIHDDIDWVIHGPPHLFTFEGPRRGKAAVLETLAAIGRQFELKRHEQKILIVSKGSAPPPCRRPRSCSARRDAC